MKKVNILLMSLILISCKTQEKNQWISAYKTNVFCSCLKNFDVQIKNDATSSLNFQIIGNFEILAETDSLGKVYSDIIRERNIWYKGGDLDGYNNIINGCLEFYNSKELRKIAVKRYRK